MKKSRTVVKAVPTDRRQRRYEKLCVTIERRQRKLDKDQRSVERGVKALAKLEQQRRRLQKAIAKAEAEAANALVETAKPEAPQAAAPPLKKRKGWNEEQAAPEVVASSNELQHQAPELQRQARMLEAGFRPYRRRKASPPPQP